MHIGSCSYYVLQMASFNALKLQSEITTVQFFEQLGNTGYYEVGHI